MLTKTYKNNFYRFSSKLFRIFLFGSCQAIPKPGPRVKGWGGQQLTLIIFIRELQFLKLLVPGEPCFHSWKMRHDTSWNRMYTRWYHMGENPTKLTGAGGWLETTIDSGSLPLFSPILGWFESKWHSATPISDNKSAASSVLWEPQRSRMAQARPTKHQLQGANWKGSPSQIWPGRVPIAHNFWGRGQHQAISMLNLS